MAPKTSPMPKKNPFKGPKRAAEMAIRKNIAKGKAPMYEESASTSAMQPAKSLKPKKKPKMK